jgi:poly(A) polymerase
MILRDNVYGTIEEDVMRRDFTVNALYYTVQNFEVHDYVDGLADIDRRCLRMIGDPEQRYREDPVRVLRAIRLAAKLNFSIAPLTAAPLTPCAQLLRSVPAARLFDEFMKLFFAGAGELTFELLHHYGVFDILFPGTGAALAQAGHQMRYLKLLHLAFANTDARVNEDKSVTPAFLLAVILWPALELKMQRMQAEGMAELVALQDGGHEVLLAQLERIAIPKRISVPMREIWDLQWRLPNRRGKRAAQLLDNKRFRAAYDFLLLREAAGEDLGGLGAWWTEFQQGSAARRQELCAALEQRAPSAAARKRRKKTKGDPAQQAIPIDQE